MLPFASFQFAFDQGRERFHSAALKSDTARFCSGQGIFVNQILSGGVERPNRRQHQVFLYDIYKYWVLSGRPAVSPPVVPREAVAVSWREAQRCFYSTKRFRRVCEDPLRDAREGVHDVILGLLYSWPAPCFMFSCA